MPLTVAQYELTQAVFAKLEKILDRHMSRIEDMFLYIVERGHSRAFRPTQWPPEDAEQN